jgi:sec-independent protein translocase protein TatC
MEYICTEVPLLSEDEKRMTFTEHLSELRKRIIHASIALIVAMLFCYAISNPILVALGRPLTYLMNQGLAEANTPPVTAPEAGTPTETPAPPEAEHPRRQKSVNFTVLNPLEFVILKFKVSGYGGLVLAFPYLLWQLCAFIFPGLKPTERRLVKILIYGCSALATLGVAVAYFGVLPLVIPYLLQWVPEGWETQLRANETIGIIVFLLMGFALAFQFPMVVMSLVYLDLLSPETLRSHRRVAVIGMSVIAAILTPPDVISMMIMLIPLALLYEISIWASYGVRRRKRARATEA